MTKIEFTKEYQEALVGLLPMDNDDVYSYTPSMFLDKDLPSTLLPVVHIHQWDNEHVEKFKMEMEKQINGKKKKNDKDSKQVAIDLIKDAVVDITNLYNPIKKTQIEYKGVETLNKLPEAFLADIMMKLAEISGVIPK